MATFQKTSWGWQLAQAQHRWGEWLQVKLSLLLPGQAIPAWFLTALGYLIYFLLLLGIVWVIYQIWRWYQRQQDRRRPISSPAIVSLRTSTIPELLAASHQWQLRHNYSEACRCLYLAMLQRLNDARLIPHQNSRTDREYAALLQQLPALQDSTVLLRTHEQLQFADRSISAAVFDSCQQAYQQLDRHLEQQAIS
jgi:hypothetical protein